jgi:hypothetical protein
MFRKFKKNDFFVIKSEKDIFLIFICFIFLVTMLWVNFLFFPFKDEIKKNHKKYEIIQSNIDKVMLGIIEEKNKSYINNKEKNDGSSKYKVLYISNEDFRVVFDTILNEKLIKIKSFSSYIEKKQEDEKLINLDKIYKNIINIECVGFYDDLIMVINILESMPWLIFFEKISISNINEKTYILGLELKINTISDNIIQFFGENDE